MEMSETKPIGCCSGALLPSADHLHSPAYLHLHSPAAYSHQHSSIGFLSPFSWQLPGLRIFDCLSYSLHENSTLRSCHVELTQPDEWKQNQRFLLHRRRVCTAIAVAYFGKWASKHCANVPIFSGRCQNHTSQWKGESTVEFIY